MCGIMGYIGNERAAPILLDGLRSLEYRGYDSAGIATLDGCLHVRKSIGPVSSLASSSDARLLPGRVGIAHTRWATHGAVTLNNAHPHLDCSGRTAVVHNGIVENGGELRDLLSSMGHGFTSDTDTEAIPHLIEDNLTKGYGLDRAVMEASRRLEGSFAFLVLSSLDDGCIYACKRHLPLVIGLGTECCVASSDPSSLPDGLDRSIFLGDGELAILDGAKPRIVDISSGVLRERRSIPLELCLKDPGKRGFRHYMEKEINEQPAVLHRIAKEDLKNLDLMASRMMEAHQVFLVAAGTSYHACLTGSYFFSDVASISTQPMLSSTFPRFSNLIDREDLVIAVSQSGETADVLDAVRSAQSRGATVLALVNIPQSTLARRSEAFVCLDAGVEKGVAATKTYTAELAAFHLAAYEAAGQPNDGRGQLADLAAQLKGAMPNLRRKVRSLAGSLYLSSFMLLIGRGITYPTAMEAALKIKELCYMPSLGLEGGELKHGSLALITEGTPCVAFVPGDDRAILSNAEEAASRGARLIGITESQRASPFEDEIVLPESGGLFPISAILPAQMLSYEMALLRGNDPDKPRNLAKSVTVR